MSLSTFAELKTALASWVNRSNLTTSLGDFITLSEAKINRRLRVSEMETAFSSTAIASGAVTRPADLAAIKALWVTGDSQRTLEAKTLEFIQRFPSLSTTPQFYAWSTTGLVFYPSSGSVEGVYYAKVPALSDSNTTNWLLTANPDLYLWAGLEQAAFFIKDDNEAAKWSAKADGLIQELNDRSMANQFSGGPLVARAR